LAIAATAAQELGPTCPLPSQPDGGRDDRVGSDNSNQRFNINAANGREAVSHLQSKPVDLLFLDVQMPKVGGFDVVK
jgi:CheY-like chemotaxis protein